ncbi:MAG: response regulator transcription factor [Pseudomonadota bacterium]
MKVLIIEDDEAIARRLEAYLTSSGFVVHHESNAEEASFAGASDEYDAIVLDLGLPGTDGADLLRQWREAGITTPVIVLTARSSKYDIVNTLEAGADDYITKPFDLDEVATRLRVSIRRQNNQYKSLMRCGRVSIDTASHRVSVDDEIVALTRIEFLFIQYLFLNQGRVVSISELADHVYDDYDHDSSIIPRHIANIRKKLGKELIETVSNRGYSVPMGAQSDQHEPG